MQANEPRFPMKLRSYVSPAILPSCIPRLARSSNQQPAAEAADVVLVIRVLFCEGVDDSMRRWAVDCRQSHPRPSDRKAS